MTNVGNLCADYWGLSHRVSMRAVRFQEFKPKKTYSVIFSFAVHWTDDKQHRPQFDGYMRRLWELLDDHGLLVFESHANDVGDEGFYARMEQQRSLFSWEGSRVLCDGMRELFIMRKRATPIQSSATGSVDSNGEGKPI